MNIKEYISSGILELYASGALSESEMKGVEQMAESYPEIQAELDAIYASLTVYASTYSKIPPSGVRQKIIDRIDSIEGYDANIFKQSSFMQTSPSMRYLLAAVIVFLVLNIISNFYMYYKWQGTEKQLTVLVDENKKMQDEYTKVKQTLDKKSNDMHMVMNRANMVVKLDGMGESPGSMATVYWDLDSKKVMLNVEKLPMPPEGMQYQLWAMKDGKSTDAGVFDMTDDPMHMMDTPVMEADTFAVTLEKMGGSSKPDMSRMYLMGKI